MNNITSTPPVPQTRKVIFNYNEQKFAKTIARLNKSLLSEIKISVWSLDPTGTGNCINILDSNLSDSEFDKLAADAAYVIYEGTPLSLRQIGVA